MEFRLFLIIIASGILSQKQIIVIRNYKHMILNTSTRGKGIQVIFNSSP
jgi:hypothetical protein